MFNVVNMSDLISREALLKEVRENKELYERERVYMEGLLLNAPGIDTSDLISKSDLLRRIDEERKYLIERGLTGAEHVITKAIRDLIDTDPEEV